jgi:hypothetical protein
MAACQCYSWWKWWSDTLWVALIRLWLHSVLCWFWFCWIWQNDCLQTFVVEFSLQSHKPMGTWMNDSFSLQDIFTSTMSSSSLCPYFPLKFHFDKMCQCQQQISPQSSLSWGFLSYFHSIMDASQRCHVDCTQLSTILALLISLNRNFDQVSNLELSLSCFCYICKACFSQCFKNVGILRFLVLETTGITAVDWLLQEKSTEPSPEIWSMFWWKV